MSRTRILVAGLAILLSAVPALAQRHSGTNHPSVNHPSLAHPSTNHPSTNHPSVNHPSIAHLGTNHPSPSHPNINHPGLNHGYTGGVYQTGYVGGPSIADTVATGGGYGYGGGGVYRGTMHRHRHLQGGSFGGGFYGHVPDINGTSPTNPATFDINSYLANFPHQPGAILDPALIPAIGRQAVQQKFTTSPPRRGGNDNP